MDNFDFFGPNLPKNGFRFKNVGVRIDIFEIPCVPIFRKMDNFDLLGPNVLKNGLEFQKSKS